MKGAGMAQRFVGVPLLDAQVAAPESIGPLIEELTPTPDPWQVTQRLASLPHLVFLDSALAHPNLGRYSFITADPGEWIWARGRHTFVAGASRPVEGDPFTVLAERLARFRCEPVAGSPPFQGGAAGLLGYDLCHHLERLPRPRLDEFQVPDLAVGIYDWVIAFDHADGRTWLFSTGYPETEPRRRRRRAEKRLAAV